MIPLTEWTPDNLFEALKIDITSSLIIARYDKTKPHFLKTYWSSKAISFILVQLDNSDESAKVMETLVPYADNVLDTNMNKARLQPIESG